MAAINNQLADVFDEISELFSTASKLVRGSSSGETKSEPVALPEHFDGKNLTPKGVDFIYGLFDEGYNRHQVSQKMDISYAAVNYRYQQWRQRRA